MSISAVKGDRKGEIEQSPKKKKFKDSTISREDLNDAITDGIKLAFKETYLKVFTHLYKAETDFDEPICKQYLDKLELPRISQMDKESLEAPLSNILIKKCIACMHCKSLWIKASAKCINVNVSMWRSSTSL